MLIAGPAIIRGLLLLFVVGFSAVAGAQRATSLSQVKTVFVDSFSGGAEAAHLRDSLVRRLSRSSRFQLVQSSKGADAIVTGTGQIWVRGYIAINPRTPSTDRQAVYSGYLSLEVAGADGQPLWSWLVTPARFSWNNIVDNLASHAPQKLIEAGESAPTTATPETAAGVLAQTRIAGAGARF